MRYHLTEVRPGIYRPFLAVRIFGASSQRIVDGLLDIACDRTLIPLNLAHDLGILPDKSCPGVKIATASGQILGCKLVQIKLGIAGDEPFLCWNAEVAVTLQRIPKVHLGFKGFLEFFELRYNGPRKTFSLKPGHNLPRVPTP